MALTTGFVALRLHDHTPPHGGTGGGGGGGSAAGFGLLLLRISNTGIL